MWLAFSSISSFAAGIALAMTRPLSGGTSRSLSPHATVGYEWNGKSTLAGDPLLGTKDKLPRQITFSGGVALAVVSSRNTTSA